MCLKTAAQPHRSAHPSAGPRTAAAHAQCSAGGAAPGRRAGCLSRVFLKCRRAAVADPGFGDSTEAQAVSDGSGPGTASPRTAPPVTVLVMRQDEAAAESALRPGLAGSEAAADAEDEAGEDDADLLDTSDPAGGGESAASPEELEDEDAEGGGAARRRGSKTCTYEGCRETTSQVAKQRKPWMCKKHRNKMYKDKYKKKKSDQALGSGGPSAASTGNVKLEESTDNILCIVKQRTGSFGDRPARPTLLEQVLNQKRLSLLRSPEVVQFLQKQQQLLNQQVLEQRQQQFPGASG